MANSDPDAQKLFDSGIGQYRRSIPEEECTKLDLLENLFREWHKHFIDSGLDKETVDRMVFDGFYPHYFSQKKRILFIGRECWGLTGFNYLAFFFDSYRKGMSGKRSLNRDKFHSRMMYIAHGLVHAEPEWQQIPYASEIGRTFGTADGLSFAFMNISKLSNESGGWAADWSSIDKAIRLSTESRNFLQEEIAILKPHVIITMCLRDKVALLGTLTKNIFASEDVNAFWLDTHGNRALLLDTWHFSAPRKRAVENYYQPICSAIQHAQGCDSNEFRQ